MKNIILASLLALGLTAGTIVPTYAKHNAEYCATLGANVSADPDPAGSWDAIFNMHARGCSEYYGTWRPMYYSNVNTPCNMEAYRLARKGYSTEKIEYHVTHSGRCFQFEDGTYGAS